MNLLFVCSRNKWRSRTAEAIFKNNGEHSIRSAGTEKSARIRVNQKILDWSDVVFVMEKKHKVRILKNFEGDDLRNCIEILDIPDEYEYMNAELIEILRERLDDYF